MLLFLTVMSFEFCHPSSGCRMRYANMGALERHLRGFLVLGTNSVLSSSSNDTITVTAAGGEQV